MAEMEVDEGTGILTDPMTNTLESKGKEETSNQINRVKEKLPTRIGVIGRIKSEIAVQSGDIDYKG